MSEGTELQSNKQFSLRHYLFLIADQFKILSMNISLAVKREHALIFFAILFHLCMPWKNSRYLNSVSSTVQIQCLFRWRLIAEFQPMVGMSEQVLEIREGIKAQRARQVYSKYEFHYKPQ